MKRTLFSICALVLSLTASAQIIKDTPKGKLIENLYRSSKSWVKKGWTGVQQGRYEGIVSKIVIGEDGCIYIYNHRRYLQTTTVGTMMRRKVVSVLSLLIV